MQRVLDSFRLDGRLALITGSSAGIGLAIARGLAQAGARVVLNGRNRSTLRDSAALLAAEGLEVHTQAFDVTDGAAVLAAVAEIEERLGPLEILVNNAGMQRRGPLEDYSETHWRELMSTNLDSAFLVGQAVARAMIPRKRGRIINICSVQSELGAPGHRPVCRQQRRAENAHQRHGHRLGPPRADGEWHRPRLFQDRTERQSGGQPRIQRLAGAAHTEPALG